MAKQTVRDEIHGRPAKALKAVKRFNAELAAAETHEEKISIVRAMGKSQMKVAKARHARPEPEPEPELEPEPVAPE